MQIGVGDIVETIQGTERLKLYIPEGTQAMVVAVDKEEGVIMAQLQAIGKDGHRKLIECRLFISNVQLKHRQLCLPEGVDFNESENHSEQPA